MSMHKKPLTRLEEEGLRAHGLPIGTPSQLSDVFRHGVAWAAVQDQGEVQKLREALTMFVHLAESRLRELGSLSPEMAKCLDKGRDALITSTAH